MKSGLGGITFEHYTVDDRLLVVDATVYFDHYGEPSLDIVEIEDENGNEVLFSSLDFKDQSAIQNRAETNTFPEDELFDEYDDFGCGE